MRALANASLSGLGLIVLAITLSLGAPPADAGRPRPGTPDAPQVTVVAVGEFIATGWISACTKDGAPLAGCTQQVRIVTRGADCSVEPVAIATPSADETWDVSGLSAGLEYTLYGVSTDTAGSSCSDPLDLKAAGEAPKVERIQFYPSMKYMFRPDPSVGATQVRFVLRADPPITSTSEVTVPIDADGEFRATVTCSFAGDGVLDVVNDSPGSSGEILDRVPILCDVEAPHDDLGSSPPAGAVGLLALESESSDPKTIRGRFAAYTETGHAASSVTTTVTRPSEDDETYARDETSTTTTIFDGSQRCNRYVTTINSKTQTGERCSAQPPPVVLWTGGSTGTGNGMRTEEYFNPPGKLRSRSVTTTSSSVDNSMLFTVAFPDVPPGMTINAIRIRQNNANDFSSSSATMGFVLNGPGGAAAVPTWTETDRSLSCPWINGKDWVWTFPQPPPTPDHTYQFQLTPSTNCTENYGETVLVDELWRRQSTGPSTSTYGVLSVQVYAEADIVETGLRLEIDRERVFPVTNERPTLPNFFGTSSTTLKASLLNAPVGTYTIRVRIDDFDAESDAGHSHGTPPERYWGELEDPDHVEDRVEVVCPIEITEGETSETCELKYQADEISGTVKLLATVDELPDARQEKDLFVGFFGLADASPILTRPQERLRSPDSDHLDEHAFFVESAAALQRFITKYKELTTSEAISPDGRYMSFNDFSLPRGGKFDIDAQWSDTRNRHYWHRDGEGIDVNSTAGDVDARTGFRRPIDPTTFESACVFATSGEGRKVREDPKLHCELGPDF